ncbi:hypothetical protein P691DRAFT_789382 [Macrolepiota fuliginosa MF-IS2]|uniref:Uncharacterized protein n=1 Tax=Macrolepiota fuliginosa MF-IS2 TaxID=1400762 RepID=A0A9P5X357_9AGAR|nr:hypothetical protein P691DRAFT_789382 [Macrolepiota fuliginosa MF-IS2]
MTIEFEPYKGKAKDELLKFVRTYHERAGKDELLMEAPKTVAKPGAGTYCERDTLRITRHQAFTKPWDYYYALHRDVPLARCVLYILHSPSSALVTLILATIGFFRILRVLKPLKWAQPNEGQLYWPGSAVQPPRWIGRPIIFFLERFHFPNMISDLNQVSTGGGRPSSLITISSQISRGNNFQNYKPFFVKSAISKSLMDRLWTKETPSSTNSSLTSTSQGGDHREDEHRTPEQGISHFGTLLGGAIRRATTERDPTPPGIRLDAVGFTEIYPPSSRSWCNFCGRHPQEGQYTPQMYDDQWYFGSPVDQKMLAIVYAHVRLTGNSEFIFQRNHQA